MPRVFILILTFFVGHILRAQSSDTFSMVTNDEIKLFLKEAGHFVTKTAKFRLSDKPHEIPSRSFFVKIAANDTLFTQTDIDYIMKQVNQRKNTNWSVLSIDNAVLIKSTDIDSIFRTFKANSGWKVFYKTYGSDFYEMSYPYFSQDKQTCIIYTGYHCGGLCGEGGLKIFRRRNNIWTQVKTIGWWES
jgi:hypothetical protein